jgi:uncharacterized protein (TIGR01777 family)
MTSNSKKIVAVTGATGLIGSALEHYLVNKGYTVKKLVRDFSKTDVDGCHIVINLAGSSINKKWTASARKEIYESRIITTRKLVNFLNSSLSNSPKLLISASAIGIYPSDNGSESSVNLIFDEYSKEKGDDFLADICSDWENEAFKTNKGVRVIIARFGVVISHRGGALPKMLFPYKLGISGRIGNGNHPFSWISLEDLVRAIEFLIEHDELKGVYNLTSEQPISNAQLTEILSKKYRSILNISIPKWGFRLVYGKASTLFTKGQRVLPKRLLESGFIFKHTSFNEAINNKF